MSRQCALVMTPCALWHCVAVTCAQPAAPLLGALSSPTMQRMLCCIVLYIRLQVTALSLCSLHKLLRYRVQSLPPTCKVPLQAALDKAAAEEHEIVTLPEHPRLRAQRESAEAAAAAAVAAIDADRDAARMGRGERGHTLESVAERPSCEAAPQASEGRTGAAQDGSRSRAVGAERPACAAMPDAPEGRSEAVGEGSGSRASEAGAAALPEQATAASGAAAALEQGSSAPAGQGAEAHALVGVASNSLCVEDADGEAASAVQGPEQVDSALHAAERCPALAAGGTAGARGESLVPAPPAASGAVGAHANAPLPQQPLPSACCGRASLSDPSCEALGQCGKPSAAAAALPAPACTGAQGPCCAGGTLPAACPSAGVSALPGAAAKHFPIDADGSLHMRPKAVRAEL